jgi:hypothetical protein
MPGVQRERHVRLWTRESPGLSPHYVDGAESGRFAAVPCTTPPRMVNHVVPLRAPRLVTGGGAKRERLIGYFRRGKYGFTYGDGGGVTVV